MGVGGQVFCDDSTKALVIKCVTMGEWVSKIVRNCVTSFMDDPFGEKGRHLNHVFAADVSIIFDENDRFVDVRSRQFVDVQNNLLN